MSDDLPRGFDQKKFLEAVNRQVRHLLNDIELRKWSIEHRTTEMTPQQVYAFVTDSIAAAEVEDKTGDQH